MILKGKKDAYELEIRVPFAQESDGLELFSNMNRRETHPHYLKMIFETFLIFLSHCTCEVGNINIENSGVMQLFTHDQKSLFSHGSDRVRTIIIL